MNQIAVIDFLDLKVPVYHSNTLDSSFVCWRVRNPNVGYKGYLYYNYETGEVTYPEGACMPLQTKSDVEIVPQFIVTDSSGVTNIEIIEMKGYLETGFKMRNKKIDID